jgi:hypothetical protein
MEDGTRSSGARAGLLWQRVGLIALVRGGMVASGRSWFSYARVGAPAFYALSI